MEYAASRTHENESTLPVWGFVYVWMLGMFVIFSLAQGKGPFPSLPHHFLGLGVAVGIYVFFGLFYTHRRDELQRLYADQQSMFSFFGRAAMIFLVCYGIEAIVYGIRYWSSQTALHEKFLLAADIKVVLLSAGMYGVCFFFTWSHFSVKENTAVIVDDTVYLPYQDVYLSPLKNYRIYGIQKILHLPHVIMSDVEFKNGDCLPITLDTTVEIQFNKLPKTSDGATADTFMQEGAIWIENVIRGIAKEKTLTEFLITRNEPFTNTIKGWQVLWRPDYPVLWPIAIKI